MRRGVQGEKNLELPPLTEHVVTVEMSEADRIFYGLVRPLEFSNESFRSCLNCTDSHASPHRLFLLAMPALCEAQCLSKHACALHP